MTMTSLPGTPEQLGYLLSDACARQVAQVVVPSALEPAGSLDAYLAQQAFLARQQLGIGGWKVGAKSEDGPVQGAPLPRAWIHASGATLARERFPVLGIELEIMFRFGRDLLPDEAPLSQEDLLASIAAVGAAIEIVSSRVRGWPEVPRLVQLADLQNHGALVTGDWVDYDAGLDVLRPHADLRYDGQAVIQGEGANPAGDPRRLLHWVVAHCRERGIAIPADTVVTTGSYTGMFFPREPGAVVGRIAGLPPVRFEVA